MAKSKKMITGCGCLLVLVAIIVAGAIIEANRTPQEKAKRASEKKALEEAKQAKSEAEAAKLRATQEKRNKAFEPFMQRLEEVNRKLGSNVLQGALQTGDRVDITVANSWHVLPYQTRFQFAQNLWKAWATLAYPNDLDKARIKILDLNGNEVGGSRALGGSLIWVQEQ